MVVTVPLVMEKVYAKSIKPALEKMKKLYSIPYAKKLIYKIIRKKILSAFGGRVRCFIMGGAPLKPEVEECFVNIRLPFTVGYGMTECAPILAYRDWNTFVKSSCGEPAPRMELKILSKDPENVPGEIVARGTNVMLGYYNEPELTKQVLTKEGWFRTGDVGKVEEDGTIYVQGHKSNLIVQADGNKVYPETIEAILNDMEGVDESLVTVWNNQLVAVVVTQMDLSVENMRNKLNEMLPSYSRITKIETQTDPLERTPKHSIKRYLYRK